MRGYEDLLVFVTLVERNSFIGAARQLGLSPAAVSRRIQELEARLGITLVNRTTRRIAVTDVGREVYEQAARGFEAIGEAERIASRHQDTASGVLRVIAPYAFTHLALMPLLPQFREQHPNVTLELLITNQPLDLVEYNCDIGVRVGEQADSTYIIRPLIRASYILVAAPGFLNSVGALRRPDDLLKLPMAGLMQPNASVSGKSPVPKQYAFVKGQKREELTFQFVLSASEPTVLMDFAEQGQGLSLVVDIMAERALNSGALVHVLPDWRIDRTMELSIIYRPRATMDSKTRAFLTFLRENARIFLTARAQNS